MKISRYTVVIWNESAQYRRYFSFGQVVRGGGEIVKASTIQICTQNCCKQGERDASGLDGGRSHLITSLLNRGLTVVHSHQVDGGYGHQRVPQLQQLPQLHVI